jgi:transcription factor IIIB subunit 2
VEVRKCINVGSFTKNRHGNPILDSSAIRINKAYKEIQQIASRLCKIIVNSIAISQYLIDMAKRIYNLASNKKFIQGRKTRHVVAVILYTVCRIQKTRHLLIDFSDTLQTNLYVLGSIYLKLIRLLQISVPLIDPSLFIHRFCAKLEFNDKTKVVSNTALRILQSMSRDWMTVGRRPSGLCGAAILISARYHGFKRTTQQIVEIVNVCDETIRKRLEEFSNTPVARLTKMEFESLRFANDDQNQGMDPPAYLKNNNTKKKVKKKINMTEKAKQIEKIFEEDDKSTNNSKFIS